MLLGGLTLLDIGLRRALVAGHPSFYFALPMLAIEAFLVIRARRTRGGWQWRWRGD